MNAQAHIRYAKRIMQGSYYVWFSLYIMLGILSVGLPGFAAMNLWQPTVFAGLGALAAAIMAFLRPHEYATAYDAACQEIWKIDIAYSLGQLDDAEATERLTAAIGLTTFKYVTPGNPGAAAETQPAKLA